MADIDVRPHTLRAVTYPGPAIALQPALDCPYDPADPDRPCRPPADEYPNDPQVCGPSEAIRDLGMEGTSLIATDEPVPLPAAVSVAVDRDEVCWVLTVQHEWPSAEPTPADPDTAVSPRVAWLLRRIEEESRNGRFPTVADIVDDGVSDGAARAALRKAWDAGLVTRYGVEVSPRGGHGMSWGLTGAGNLALEALSSLVTAELDSRTDDGTIASPAGRGHEVPEP